MADGARQMPQQLSSISRRLSLSQKVTLGAVAAGVIVAIVALVSFVNKPSYGTLFSNLNEQDAAKIVDKLREKSVPYTLEDGGKTIQIPKQQIYDMRLALAGEGLPRSSTIGYEIFDQTNLGVSDLVQKINYRRALEGELARTILQIEEVEGARVHIVVPEKALFKEDEKPSTASVILKLRSGKPLKNEVVRGISHLIASSVEGMDAGNVTILDSRGVMLSENKPNSVAAVSSSQYELQQHVEGYLAQKAQVLLENVVGQGNALVQVSAELDFRQVERTLEQYDPENTAIRSEQVQEEKMARQDSTGTGGSRTNSLTNYEVNKTVEHIVENIGNIKRLSIAAVVNGVAKTVEKDGQKTTEIGPRSADEMAKLTELVKKSVGFNTQRNDEVSVTNLSFGVNSPEQDFVYKQTPVTDWYGWGWKVLLLAAMAGGVMIIRSLLNRVRMQIPVMPMPSGFAVQAATAALRAKQSAASLAPAEEEEISEQALLRSERRKKVGDYVRQKPAETSRLLKVWLAEE